MSRNKGFTIVEILIAMVVLSLGLLGILGVFPVGIKQTAKIVQDSNAAIIAESVRNSIEMSLQSTRIEDDTDRGFVYLGEGVKALLEEKGLSLPVDVTSLDGNPPSINKTADYWVKLPQGEKKYLYPRSNPAVFEMGDYTANKLPPVKRVFPCGANITKQCYDSSLTRDEREEALKDPFPQYSYAFIIREAKVGHPPAFMPGHSLYELTILIYRNFPLAAFKSGNDLAGFANNRHQPIETFKTLVSF